METKIEKHQQQNAFKELLSWKKKLPKAFVPFVEAQTMHSKMIALVNEAPWKDLTHTSTACSDLWPEMLESH